MGTTDGGNFGPVKTVAPDIARELDATVIALADLDEHMQLLNEGLSEAGIEYNWLFPEPVAPQSNQWRD